MPHNRPAIAWAVRTPLEHNAIEKARYAAVTIYMDLVWWATLAALGFCISGCAAKDTSVAYYKRHTHELDERLDSCIAKADVSQDCSNAKQAFSELHGL